MATNSDILVTLWQNGGLTSAAIANLFDRDISRMQDFMAGVTWNDEIRTAVGVTISDILNGRV